MIEIKFILLYYIIISTILFALMGVDKLKAVLHKWRISEKTLLCLGASGGFLGGFAAMALFRHKTKKSIFWVVYTLSVVIHVIATILLINAEVYLC